MAVRLCLGLKILKLLCIWSFCDPLFSLVSRQCAVLTYNLSMHQEIRHIFEVWCTLLFKLKEAKCLQCPAGYRECASQQIPTQVLLQKKSEQTWNNSPRDMIYLTRMCPCWFLPATEQIKSQHMSSRFEQQTCFFVAAMGIFITLLLYCSSGEIAPFTASAIQFITSLTWSFWACHGSINKAVTNPLLIPSEGARGHQNHQVSRWLWTFTRW